MEDKDKTREELLAEIDVLGNRISELEKSGAELKLVRQRMEFILAATKTGLDVIDSEFNVVYVDPAWEKIYGDPTGRKCYEYFADRKNMCPGCGIPKAFATKKPVVAEEILPKEGGRPILVTTIPFQNEEGEWLVAEINIDIAERKRMEKELESRVRDLEKFHKVAVDRELRMIELKQRIKELEARLAANHGG